MKLIALNNTVVELSRIKAISLNGYRDLGETNRIKVELNTRNEYLYNPDLEIYKLIQNEEVIYIEHPNYETAKQHLLEMMEMWEESLREMD
ncbi:hypothetical protein SCB49_02424 [unidentified eubacterium SCB49]|nr:hypothetical protein SCB49_02424 [unidentified eubacterium SCB49]